MIIHQGYPNILEGPFDSPIEEEFAYAMSKILVHGIEFNCQVDF